VLVSASFLSVPHIKLSYRVIIAGRYNKAIAKNLAQQVSSLFSLYPNFFIGNNYFAYCLGGGEQDHFLVEENSEPNHPMVLHLVNPGPERASVGLAHYCVCMRPREPSIFALVYLLVRITRATNNTHAWLR